MVVNVGILLPPSKDTLPEISPPIVKVLEVVHCLASLIVPTMSALLNVAVALTVKVSPTTLPMMVLPLTFKLPSVRMLPSAEPTVNLVAVPSVIVKSSPAPVEPTIVMPAFAVISPVTPKVEDRVVAAVTPRVPVIDALLPTNNFLAIATPPAVLIDAAVSVEDAASVEFDCVITPLYD